MLRWWRKRQDPNQDPEEDEQGDEPEDEPETVGQRLQEERQEVSTPEPTFDPYGAGVAVSDVWESDARVFIPLPPGRRVEALVKFYPANFTAGKPRALRLPVLGWMRVKGRYRNDWHITAVVPLGLDVGPLWILEEAMSQHGERLHSIVLEVDGWPLWRIEGSIIPHAYRVSLAPTVRMEESS